MPSHTPPGPPSGPAPGTETGPEPEVRVPYLRVVRGDATPEEIAALLVALRSAAPAAPKPPRKRDNWRKPRLRTPPPPGAGAWRASALPH